MTTTVVPRGAKRHRAFASAVRCRMHPCESGVPSWARVCTLAPSSTGMSWKPIAAVLPCAKRTNHLIDPESSIPQACSERE